MVYAYCSLFSSYPNIASECITKAKPSLSFKCQNILKALYVLIGDLMGVILITDMLYNLSCYGIRDIAQTYKSLAVKLADTIVWDMRYDIENSSFCRK